MSHTCGNQQAAPQGPKPTIGLSSEAACRRTRQKRKGLRGRNHKMQHICSPPPQIPSAGTKLP